MGKKKKKIKHDIFERDYSDISVEDQFKMLALSDRLMNGEDVDFNFIEEDEKVEKSKKKKSKGVCIEDIVKGATSKPTIPVIEETPSTSSITNFLDDAVLLDSEEIIVDESEDDLSMEDYASMIVDDCRPSTPLTSFGEALLKAGIKVSQGTTNSEYDEPQNVEEPEDEDNEESSDFDDVFDDDSDDFDVEHDDEDEEPTLDNQFKVIQKDDEYGDIVIKDAWKDFKSHTINFYNMRPAIMNFEESVQYSNMRGLAVLALAFIAGPVLVIKHGNEKFSNFIKTTKSFDKERIFILRKEDDDIKDTTGKRLIHFLVYYIDQESQEELEILLERFSNLENPDDVIALDILYSIYEKAMSRHENPWSSYVGIDALIDQFESSDEDIDFVLDLIRKDKDTELGESTFEYFMDNFVLPIEAFIGDHNEIGAFDLYRTILRHTMENESNYPVVDDVIQVPDNFGYNNEGVRTTSTETEYEIDDEGGTSIEDDIDDVDEIDDTDASDLVIDLGTRVDDEPKSKLQSSKENSGIKKFGTKPTNGPLVLNVGK